MAYDPIKQLQGLPQPPMLKPGQEPWAVRVLRRVLSAHGVGDKAVADPVRTPEVSPVYDAALEQLVRDFQR
jgi:murein L,D-transpeptidase YcbB/YkuD